MNWEDETGSGSDVFKDTAKQETPLWTVRLMTLCQIRTFYSVGWDMTGR